jgi:hypothetical protein
VSNDHIPSRPHVQGTPAPLRLRSSAQELTDGAGLLALRRLWDRLKIGRWLDEEATELGGHFRSSLMVELWVALLWYGGGWLDDLALLEARRIRRLFGWVRIPDPTTFGRWLRRAGRPLLPILDRLIRHLVRIRWSGVGVPQAVTLVLDSTVAVRYGLKQAGAEVGYNPKKPGRPSHHPLLAFLQETGDLLGILWRPGSAWAGARTEQWLPELVAWLREAGVKEITVRLDKGFFAERIVRALQDLEVTYLLKVPNHAFVREELGTWRKSIRAEGIFPKAEAVWTNSGTLWGDRLLSLEGRRVADLEAEGGLAIETTEVTEVAHILTNRPGIHALTAWRAYNAGAVVEQRIEELGQLSVGQTAVDDLDGNRLLWALGGLAYQLFHLLRSRLPGRWRVAQPKRLRTWLFRLAGRFTTRGGQWRLDVVPEALGSGLLGRTLQTVRAPPPRYAH